jgi:hypothetical protein
MSKKAPDRTGKSRLLPTLAGLFFLAWLVAVFFAVRDTFIHDRPRNESSEGATVLSLPDSSKGRFPILDRGGRELAVSFPTKSVYARPLEVEHPDAVALFLARELGLSERQLRRDLKEERSFVWLGRQISATAVNNIRERKLPGIYVVDEVQRFYPQGKMAAQLLGFAREGRGLTGIEAQYDQQLQTAVEIGGENGPPRGPLLLTLDLRIQELVEQELAQLAGETGATGGEGIVLDSRTGEVLALANLPAFEPNFFGDSDEKSRHNRALTLALPASGFGQLFRLAASSQPLQIEVPAPPPVAPPKHNRLAALKKELKKTSPVATFGGGPNRLLPFEGGYRSPGLAALMKVSEPPGFAAFMGSLGFGQKMVFALPVGVIEKAAAGEHPPTFQATGGELLTSLARLLNQDGIVAPQVVAGVADPQSGKIQAEARLEGGSPVEAEKGQRLRDYLTRLAPAQGGELMLEELTEVPGPELAEAAAAAEETEEGNGRAVGQVWTPEQGGAAPQTLGRPEGVGGTAKPGEIVPGRAGLKGMEMPATSGPGPDKESGKAGEKGGEQEPGKPAEAAGPKHFISLLVALPGGGDGSGVLVLLALEGARLEPTAPSPLRLAAERILPQVRLWAAENIGPPASITWTPNEPLWQSEWQKLQAGREVTTSLGFQSGQRKMPNLRGASLRKALQVLNNYDLKIRIEGVGRVVEQRPAAGETIGNEEVVLTLSGLNLIEVRPDREVAVGVESGTDRLKIFSMVNNPRPAGAGGN